MSVSCQRAYKLVVTGIPVPSAYWKYDEVGSVNRVDAVGGLIQTVFSGSVPSTTGIISNGANFPANAQINELFLGFPSGLNMTGTGFSFTFWMKPISFGVGLDFEIGVGGSSSVEFTLSGAAMTMVAQPDNNPNISLGVGNLVMGAWHFFTCVYNAAADTVTCTVNRGTPFVINLLAPFDPFTNASNTSNNFGVGQYVLDEMGIWMNTVLAPAVLDSLYNGGSASRPPFS